MAAQKRNIISLVAVYFIFVFLRFCYSDSPHVLIFEVTGEEDIDKVHVTYYVEDGKTNGCTKEVKYFIPSLLPLFAQYKYIYEKVCGNFSVYVLDYDHNTLFNNTQIPWVDERRFTFNGTQVTVDPPVHSTEYTGVFEYSTDNSSLYSTYSAIFL